MPMGNHRIYTHEGAFGIQIPEENLDKALKAFDEMIDEEDLQGEIMYDLEVDASEVTEMDIKEVEKFGRISGQGFPVPTFKITGLVVEEASTKKLGSHVRAVMGADKKTVKINLDDGWAMMKFRSNEGYGLDIHEEYYNGDSFITEIDVVGQLNLNNFYNFGLKRNVTTKQVFAEDYIIK